MADWMTRSDSARGQRFGAQDGAIRPEYASGQD